MFYSDPKKGLKELHRVLAEGGTCVVATWQAAETVVLLEATLLAAAPGTVVQRDASPHPMMFRDAGVLKEAAREAGFKGERVEAVERIICFTKEMVEKFFFLKNPAVAYWFAGLSEEQVGLYEKEVWERLKAYTTEEGFKFTRIY
eukprot:TRINITY_DN6164_c0_g1_i1.p1 TRINITY_DN6164_c0_g1~~TRINITY_DN6164_c0_g1_i1.p1  ORF type:complete len:145 (+),score=32.06 TRINITY_DN6164_c0_g1_i1:389-823(+)